MKPRPRDTTVLLWTTLLAGACYAYQPAPSTPTPGARVRLVFASSTTVATFQAGADSARRLQPGVLEASGTIEASSADTLALRLGGLRTATGALAMPDGTVALIPTARIGRIEERRFQAGTTALAGLGAAALALTGLVILVIIDVTRQF